MAKKITNDRWTIFNKNLKSAYKKSLSYCHIYTLTEIMGSIAFVGNKEFWLNRYLGLL